jgi:hypothetical protein
MGLSVSAGSPPGMRARWSRRLTSIDRPITARNLNGRAGNAETGDWREWCGNLVVDERVSQDSSSSRMERTITPPQTAPGSGRA